MAEGVAKLFRLPSQERDIPQGIAEVSFCPCCLKRILRSSRLRHDPDSLLDQGSIFFARAQPR